MEVVRGMTYSNIERWKVPQHYFGAQWPDYYSAGVGRSRDSSALELANFDVMPLGGETGEDDDGISLVTIRP